MKLIQMKSQKQSYIHCFILASLVFPIPKDSGWKQSKIKGVYMWVGGVLILTPPHQLGSKIQDLSNLFTKTDLKMVKDF